MRAKMVNSSNYSSNYGMRQSLLHQRLILPTDTDFNIFTYFIIDGVWITCIFNIGSDEPLLFTRNPIPPVGVLQLETQQVCIPHHVPFPLDDSDVCLILLSDLLKQPFDPTLANMQGVFHHGVSPPVKLVPPSAPQGPPRCLHNRGCP